MIDVGISVIVNQNFKKFLMVHYFHFGNWHRRVSTVHFQHWVKIWGGLWVVFPGSGQYIVFTSFFQHGLVTGRIMAVQILCHLSWKDLFWNKWWKKDEEQANPGSLQKQPWRTGGSAALLAYYACMCFSDRGISRDEFIFYSKRLMRLLIEFALSMLPFRVSTGNLKIFNIIWLILDM